MTVRCNKCEKMGLCFRAMSIDPSDYIEGRNDAQIWIIGLNPKKELGYIDLRTLEDFKVLNPNIHSYFRDFKKVSKRLFSNWESSESTVAHTDLIKCFSPEFPPKIGGRSIDKAAVVNNCKEILFGQISSHKPKILICNGADVCKSIVEFFPPLSQHDLKSITSYRVDHDFDGINHAFWIVLSGFIGRIDDWSKRRLGKEIEQIIELEQIEI